MIKTFETYKKKIKDIDHDENDPFKEEDWSEKEFNYSKFKGSLTSFLNQFVSDDNLIDSFIKFFHDKEFMKTANKEGIISDLRYMLTQAGVSDEKSLSKIEKEIREL